MYTLHVIRHPVGLWILKDIVQAACVHGIPVWIAEEAVAGVRTTVQLRLTPCGRRSIVSIPLTPNRRGTGPNTNRRTLGTPPGLSRVFLSLWEFRLTVGTQILALVPSTLDNVLLYDTGPRPDWDGIHCIDRLPTLLGQWQEGAGQA